MVAAEQNASAARATMEAWNARPDAGDNSPVDPFADPFALDGGGDGGGGLVDSEMADEQVSRQRLSLARACPCVRSYTLVHTLTLTMRPT